MAEVKAEPLMFSPESLRVQIADGELSAVAALTAQQQRTAKPAPQQNAKQIGRTRRASSFDSDDEPIMPTDAAELKKMTSKERRQMRNKISARNFRVRRKEYISTLEAQVQLHQDEAKQLREQMFVMEEENKKLQEEIEQLRRQSALETTKQPARVPPTSILTTHNFDKDLSISGSRPTDTYRNDSHILVSSAIIPEWNWDHILARDIAPKTTAAAPKITTPTIMTDSSLLTDITFAAAHPREAALATAFVAYLSQSIAACLTAMPVEDIDRWLYPVVDEPVPAPAYVKSDWDMSLKTDEPVFSPKPVPEELTPESGSAAYMEWLYDAMIMARLSPPQAVYEGEGAVSSLNRLASFFWWDGTSSV
jgi:hypothetical protein